MAAQWTIVGGSLLPHFQLIDTSNSILQTFPKSEYVVTLSSDKIIITHIYNGNLISIDYDDVVSPALGSALLLYNYLITNQYFFKSASSAALVPTVVQDFNRIDGHTIRALYSDASIINKLIYTPSAGTSNNNTLVWNGVDWVESTFTAAGVWLNGGNTWVATSSIGNISNHTLNFLSNNLIRMSILNTGNIDIATNIQILTTSSTVGNIYQNSFRVFHTYGTDNLFIGKQAGNYTLTGNSNVGIGYQAGTNLTSGVCNTAIGYAAGQTTIGDENVHVGCYAGFGASTAIRNTFIGHAAGYQNTGANNICIGERSGLVGSGSTNILVGNKSGYSLTSGNNNVFIGDAAGYSTTSGSLNTCVGVEAGFGLGTTGTFLHNVAFGYRAGFRLNTGAYNVCIGTQAGNLLDSGSYNTYVGRQCGYTGVSNDSNCGFGHNSLSQNTANNNVCFGQDTGAQTTSGGNNTFIGHLAGYTNTTGTDNICIGMRAGFGEGFSATASNQCFFAAGSNPITNLYFNGAEYGSPTSIALNAGGGSGTDIAAANITIAGGKGTGNATPGKIKFQTSTTGATGTTLQTLADRIVINDTQTIFSTGICNKVTATAINYNALTSDYLIIATADNITITLPASPADGQTYSVKAAVASPIGVTIGGNGKNIDSAGTYVLAAIYETITIIYSTSQTKWFITAKI